MKSNAKFFFYVAKSNYYYRIKDLESCLDAIEKDINNKAPIVIDDIVSSQTSTDAKVKYILHNMLSHLSNIMHMQETLVDCKEEEYQE